MKRPNLVMARALIAVAGLAGTVGSTVSYFVRDSQLIQPAAQCLNPLVNIEPDQFKSIDYIDFEGKSGYIRITTKDANAVRYAVGPETWQQCKQEIDAFRFKSNKSDSLKTKLFLMSLGSIIGSGVYFYLDGKETHAPQNGRRNDRVVWTEQEREEIKSRMAPGHAKTMTTSPMTRDLTSRERDLLDAELEVLNGKTTGSIISRRVDNVLIRNQAASPYGERRAYVSREAFGDRQDASQDLAI